MQIDDVESAINDNEVIAELEHIMSEWCAALAEVMAREAEKHPIGSGPLAGVLFCNWLCMACVQCVRLTFVLLSVRLYDQANVHSMSMMWLPYTLPSHGRCIYACDLHVSFDNLCCMQRLSSGVSAMLRLAV